MTQKDFFARTEDKLTTGIRRGAHLPWPARARLRWRSLTRHSRALAVLIAGLIVVGPALAATGVFNTGSTVPPAKRQVATVGNGVAVHHVAELTTLRVADPQGGPAWGLRLTDTSRGALCPVVGRVEHDQIGSLGVDGAFQNDGLFHPYAADYPNYTFDGTSCAPTDAQGYGFVFDTWFGAPTSASLRGESSHGVACFGRWIEPPFVAARRRKLHPGLPAQRVCPASEVRDIYFGLLGPDAKEIAYRTLNGRVRTEATASADGAYLVVLPHSPHNDPSTGTGPGPSRPPIVGIAMRTGANCGVLGPLHPRRPLSDCTHEGFAAPTVRAPAEASVRSPITIRPVRRKYQPHAVSINFIARVAVQSTRSYYAASVTNPSHKNPGAPRHSVCGAGGAGDGSDRDLHAGQRIKLIIDTSDLCYGEVHGIVEYVIDRSPQGGFLRPIPMPVTRASNRFYTVRFVGHFSYNVPRTKVSP
jgi:hypothetical protein